MPTNSDQIINKRFDELIVRFRPEFGNVRHIEIVNDLGKLTKCEDLLREKQKVAAGIPELQDKVQKLKNRLGYSLKEYGQNKTDVA